MLKLILENFILVVFRLEICKLEVFRLEIFRLVDVGFGGFGDVGVFESLRGNVDLVYVLSMEFCGYCFIINNVNFCCEFGFSICIGFSIDCEKL